MSGRKIAVAVVACAAAVLAGCSSATSGTGTTAPGAATAGGTVTNVSPSPDSSSGSPTASTAPSPSGGTSTGASTESSQPGIFVGSWQGHGRILTVLPDGTVSVVYRVYVWCTDDPAKPCDGLTGNEIIPGGNITLHITTVVTADNTSTATATVQKSTDPHYPVGSTQTLPLKGDVITSPWGTMCDPKAEDAGDCGA